MAKIQYGVKPDIFKYAKPTTTTTTPEHFAKTLKHQIGQSWFGQSRSKLKNTTIGQSRFGQSRSRPRLAKVGLAKGGLAKVGLAKVGQDHDWPKSVWPKSVWPKSAMTSDTESCGEAPPVWQWRRLRLVWGDDPQSCARPQWEGGDEWSPRGLRQSRHDQRFVRVSRQMQCERREVTQFPNSSGQWPHEWVLSKRRHCAQTIATSTVVRVQCASDVVSRIRRRGLSFVAVVGSTS